MDWKELEIDNKLFKWGQTFNDIFDSFGRENLNVGTSSWKLHKVKSNGFLGLEGISCEFYGPAYDKPISSISFELKPIKIGLFQKPHSPFMKQLESSLGKPDGIHKNPLPNGKKYNEGYSSSSVIYAPHWWFGDFRIGLSVYGGIRNEVLGETAALLYIGWYNEKEMAKPYIEDYYKSELNISKSLTLIEDFELEYSQMKNFRSDYELPDDSIADKDDEIRAAQLSLYYSNLYRTPNDLSDDMKPNQINLMFSDTAQKYVLANKFDFTTFDNESKIEFRKILPARSCGGTEISVGDMTLRDIPNSQSLTNLKKKLKKLGLKVKSVKYYDD
tara:strand:+ start:29 stop:1018 length:990 start_codon:yes stop_codon:yes gene_type:complete